MGSLINKQYSDTEHEFIFQWADRWRQLFDLIYDLLRTDKPPTLPSLPTEHGETRYQELSSWLIDNEVTFLPLWKDFCTSGDWALDVSEDLIAEIHNAEKALENPFFCWYGPEDLKVFFQAYVVDKQSGRPNEKQAWTTAMTLLQLDVIAVDFVLWICDMDGNTL